MEQKEANEKIIPRKLLLWITIVIAVSLVLLSFLSIYFVFIYPENQLSQLGITNVTEKANFINQTRTTFISFFVLFAQILGGGAVAIGIYIGWGNLKVALATLEGNQNKDREELKLAQETLKANMKNAQDNLKVAQEGQITERFTRAIDQLGAVDQKGNPAIEIRLGGIYALERIANGSDEDYWPIMEILTAYIRENSACDERGYLKVKHNKGQNETSLDTLNEVSSFDTTNGISLDIQAILTVIKRRNYSFGVVERYGLDLRNTYLYKADLLEAHLEEANLINTNLSHADLRKAHLERINIQSTLSLKITKTKLEGAYMEGAYMEEANLNFANLKGAHLEEANLTGASFSLAILDGANLRGANLEGASLSCSQLSKVKTLYNAKLDPKLEKELRAKGFGKLIDNESER